MKRKQAPKKHRSKQPARKARRAPAATLAPIASPARAPEPSVKYSRIWP